ncbi:hypothetical protein GAY28_18910 [Azospirillum brasilense]|nr:hypothetical protein [Azospirillum brasilense]
MRDHDLTKGLEAAAAGVRATRGTEAKNLFADALTELNRLYRIEADVSVLLCPVHHNDDSRGWSGTEPKLAEMTKRRLEAGRRLGIAVGAIQPNPKGE